MRCLPILFIGLLISHICTAQSWADTLTLIDKTFSQYKPENPGCQVSVSRNGEIIFSKAWGMADLERSVPLTTHSILEAGSVSKQFTAAAILLLEQQGKLSLDDDVRKYIPELPDYGAPILLRQMMHHTSGLRDWGAIAELTGWPRGTKFYSNEDALEIIARQQHLNNPPGAEFLYSNSNYNLFAIVVQRVSGLNLAAFTKKFIFEPAGMTHTSWRDDPNRIVPNRAIAYAKRGRGYHTDMPNEYVYGNGGLLTTTEDLLKWNQFYQQHRFGTASLYRKQTETEPLANRSMNIYAAGLFINNVMGWYTVTHNGSTAGYRANLETFTELGLSFAVLSNTGEFNINSVAAMLRKIFVHPKTPIAPTSEKSVQLSEAALNHFTGLYRNERDGSSFYLSLKNQQIFLDNDLPLKPLSENIVASNNFLLKLDGSKGWYIPFSPRDTIPLIKLEPAHPLPKDLEAYTGKYFSPETNSWVTIEINKDSLTIHLKPSESHLLIPTYKDGFKLDALDADIAFIRNGDSGITGLSISITRARNVVFKKAESSSQ